MTGHYIILPVLSQLFLAVLLLFFWRRIEAKRIISVAGNVLVLLMSIALFQTVWTGGTQTMQAGKWMAPFGISFVADVFSCTMVLLNGIAGLAVSIFSTVGVSKARQRYGYFSILHFLLMGLNGAFLTGDIFNLYVWFEIIIIASFVLMTLGGRKPQIEGGIKYVTINLLASVIFLTAIGILYGLTGSLNMADLSEKVAQVPNRGLVDVTALLFFVGFGIKSAVFPLYFWLPASYHTPPSAIAAIFGGLLTKVGVYALLRVFTIIFIPDLFLKNTFLIIAIATLLAGAFGILAKMDLRRIFSYLIVCHIGFMITGIGLFTEVALAGAVFYMIHDIVVKTNIFLVSGLIYKIKGTVSLKQLGGMYAGYPKLSLVMALILFSLAGIPPLSGFWPKILLYKSSLAENSYVLLSALIVASFITLYIIGKIWADVFWKTQPVPDNGYTDGFAGQGVFRRFLLVAPVIMLAIITLYIGFFAENIMMVANRIAYEMMNPAEYIRAVLK